MPEVSDEDMVMIHNLLANIEDEGPTGEGWQSDELKALIRRLNAESFTPTVLNDRELFCYYCLVNDDARAFTDPKPMTIMQGTLVCANHFEEHVEKIKKEMQAARAKRPNPGVVGGE